MYLHDNIEWGKRVISADHSCKPSQPLNTLVLFLMAYMNDLPQSMCIKNTDYSKLDLAIVTQVNSIEPNKVTHNPSIDKGIVPGTGITNQTTPTEGSRSRESSSGSTMSPATSLPTSSSPASACLGLCPVNIDSLC